MARGPECVRGVCRDCLRSVILMREDPEVACPYRDDAYACDSVLQEREIRAVRSKQRPLMLKITTGSLGALALIFRFRSTYSDFTTHYDQLEFQNYSRRYIFLLSVRPLTAPMPALLASLHPRRAS